jgi:hypothetical protein
MDIRTQGSEACEMLPTVWVDSTAVSAVQYFLQSTGAHSDHRCAGATCDPMVIWRANTPARPASTCRSMAAIAAGR